MSNVSGLVLDPDPLKRAIYWLADYSWHSPTNFETLQELSTELQRYIDAAESRATAAEEREQALQRVLDAAREINRCWWGDGITVEEDNYTSEFMEAAMSLHHALAALDGSEGE